ncbi:MAG: GNAT family N-acetyltransferase, partial [Methanobacterium paludis]|nr:GNAT family N-acetyltransferase [Methanobacterium paludis]
MGDNAELRTIQPVGPPVDTTPARRPERVTLTGRCVTVMPLNPTTHAEPLYRRTHGTGRESLWTYLFDDPFPGIEAFRVNLKQKARRADPLYFAIVDNASGEAVGYASYMRIDLADRVMEVGGILFSPDLQRTTGATEAMYLMARYAFEDLGCRRYEWKCDALNAPSRRAALRLGFKPEGVFRQHMIMKGRSRDTAWFSMLDTEWPERKAAFERWLDPSNFDE